VDPANSLRSRFLEIDGVRATSRIGIVPRQSPEALESCRPRPASRMRPDSGCHGPLLQDLSTLVRLGPVLGSMEHQVRVTAPVGVHEVEQHLLLTHPGKSVYDVEFVQ
jgi:hypothetical protein